MNKAGFDVLYREHYGRVLGLCRRMLGGVADAEDAAQEVFMRGYRAIGGYRTGDPFGPWIGAIATNYCIDVLRRRRRLADVFSDVAADAGEVADPSENGVALLIDAYQSDAITQAV